MSVSSLPTFVMPRGFPNMRGVSANRVHELQEAGAGVGTGVGEGVVVTGIWKVVKSGTADGESMVLRAAGNGNG